MAFCMLYITAASADEAKAIGRTLVEERLVACANVFEGVTSFYHWQGSLQEDREAVLIAKTRQERLEAIIARVKAVHSYATPCVVALPITAGNPAYLDWLEMETA